MTHFMRNLGDLTGLDIAMAGFPPVDAVSVCSVRGSVAPVALSPRIAAFGAALGRRLGAGLGRDGRCRNGRVAAPGPCDRSAS